MRIIKTLTLTEFENRLRELGIPISTAKTVALINQGLFDGVVYNAGGQQNNYLILAKEFEKWVDQYAEEAVFSDDVQAFLQMQESGEKPEDNKAS